MGQSINANDLKWSFQLSLDQERWEIPAAETCYFLAKQRTPQEGGAGSALLPSPLQEEESYPALPTDPVRQGRGKRLLAKGWCPSRQLSSQHWNCRYSANYSPGDTRQLQALFPLPTSLLSTSSAGSAIQVAYQPQRPEESLPARPPYLPFPPHSLEAIYNRGEGRGG